MNRTSAIAGFILLIIISVVIYPGMAQNAFQKIYTTDYDVECFGAYQETDGGYMITGVAQTGTTQYNVFMTRTDCHGAILWSKSYNSSSTIGNISQRVVETHDHGFLLAASIGFYGSYNILLVRTDADGNALWKKIMQGSGDDLVNSVVETESHDYIIAGTTSSYGEDAGSFYKDIYLMKVDDDGNFIWGKTYGTAGNYDEAFDVIETYDGHYAATGRYITSGAFHCFLLKTDADGDMIYMKAFGDTLHNVTGYAIANTFDGGYIITGSSTLTKDSYLDYPDEFLIKTDAAGDTLWCKSYHGSNIDGSENGSSVIVLNDGSYAIGVATFSYPSVGFVPNKHCVLKTDAEGNMEWLKAYNKGGSHYPYLTTAKGESGFVLSGFTNFYVPHLSPMIIKLDENFDSGCNETDYTGFTYQEYMPAKVKTPVVQFGSGGSLINTTMEEAFAMSDTMLCSSFSDSCMVFTAVEQLPEHLTLLNVYPNPASENISIEFFSLKEQEAGIEIINELGENVRSFSKNLSAGKNVVHVDIGYFPSGVFVLKIKSGEKYSVRKFFKE
ncbi:MAG: T9SS type A sorting domain-containing protein [Chitinophagales bacterium]